MERRGVERVPSTNSWLSVSQRHIRGDAATSPVATTCVRVINQPVYLVLN